MSFPKDFVWGVATASYQIEGSAMRAGGGKSVWDMHCEREGAVKDGDTGFYACDHVLHYKEDIALMRAMGVQAYRFSLSWARIFPDGIGNPNDEGVEFYDNLINELLANGIQPWITLFHWDYPMALYNQGGWLNPDSSQWFADYTEFVVDKFSDRVKHWMTLNEPQCFMGLGHLLGVHAPGDKLSLPQVLVASHNVLLSHGRAVQAIRAGSKLSDPQIGFAPVGVLSIPATNSKEDIEAARQDTFSVKRGGWAFNNTWWLDPVFHGEYPADGLESVGKAAPPVGPDDMAIIKQPLDFFGANIYQSSPVKAGPDGKAVSVDHPIGIGRTAFDWPVVPESLYWGPRFFYERYKKPIIMTENGMAGTDWIALDGKVHDAPRIDFLNRYLNEFHRAHTESGVDIAGYFHWSFLDNFEWAEGYSKRFGLIYVDYATQKRIPKDSAAWFRSVIESNGESL